MIRPGTGLFVRPGRLTGGLFVVIAFALTIGLLVQCWLYLTVGSVPLTTDNPGAVLLIDSPGQPSGQYRLLQSGFSAAGVVSRTWILPAESDAETRKSGEQLQTAVSKLAEDAGCAEFQVWVIAAGDAVPMVWDAACGVRQMAGLFMIVPRSLGSLNVTRIQKWPGNRSLAIFCAQTLVNGLDNQADRLFFETMTGEDTTLFPGYQGGSSLPVQYFTADGKVWLGLYPALAPEWALLSPRVLPDVAGLLAGWSSDEQLIGRFRMAAGILVDLPFKILLTGLLILVVLVILNLFLMRIRHPAVITVLSGPDHPAGQSGLTHWPAEILIWLPSVALAGSVGWLAERLSSGQIHAIFISLAVLPGCRGWIWLLFRKTRDHQRTQAKPKSAGPAALYRKIRLPIPSVCLVGLAAPLGLLLMAGLWSWLSFGAIVPQPWYWFILPILIIVDWPAGMAGTCGRIGVYLEDGTLPAPGLRQTIWQHLPYLLLPVLAAILIGWAGLAAFSLLLVIHLWSTGLGKAMTLISRRPAVGSLAQSTAYALGALMPAVLMGIQGLFH